LIFFLHYFENDFYEIVAFNTNLYTVQNSKTNFKPTNKHEIQTLIAIHLIMGCLKSPRIRMYWEEKFRVLLISVIVTVIVSCSNKIIYI